MRTISVFNKRRAQNELKPMNQRTLSSNRHPRPSASRLWGALTLSATLVGCSASEEPAVEGEFAHVYATSAIVFNDEGETAYVSVLPDLEREEISFDEAREYPGWASVYGSQGKLFVSDGEAPTMRRFDVTGSGELVQPEAVSFLDYGAAFAGGAFLSPGKAYLFAETGVIWDPAAMEITGTFDLPDVEDHAGGQAYSGLATGRQFAAHGNRAYVATNWANWDTYEVSEESLIVVLDTDNDEVVATLPAPCPYLDVATVDDDGYVYFSNWPYSVPQTLLYGKRKACAVRIAPGAEELDESWSLQFDEVTGGHEGAALRYLGDGKALFVAYDESRLDGTAPEEYPGELADRANWQFWTIDLKTLDASPVDGLDWSAGGYYMSRVGDRSFVLAPSDDYSSTTFYEVLTDGTAERRFVGEGWSLDLVQVR